MTLADKYVKALHFAMQVAYNKGKLDERRGKLEVSNDTFFNLKTEQIEELLNKGMLL